MGDPWKAELVTFYFLDKNFDLQEVRDEEADFNRPRPQKMVANAAHYLMSPKFSIAAEAEGLLSSVHWCPFPWNLPESSTIDKVDIPEHILRSSDLPSFLFCRTSFAILSEDTYPIICAIVVDGDRDNLSIMPVTWTDGVVYRLPAELYHTPLDEWMALPTGEWNLVTLG